MSRYAEKIIDFLFAGQLSPLTDEHYDAQDPRSAMEQLFTDVETIGKGNFGEVYRGKYRGIRGNGMPSKNL